MIKVKFNKDCKASVDGINIERYKENEVVDVSTAFYSLFNSYCTPIEEMEEKEEIPVPLTREEINGIMDVDLNGDPIVRSDHVDKSIWEENEEEKKVIVKVDPDLIVFEEDWLRSNKTVKELKEMCSDLKLQGYSKMNEDDLIDLILKSQEV